jgi:hypothetical protein
MKVAAGRYDRSLGEIKMDTQGNPLLPVVCASVVGLPISLLIGAVVLRAACHFVGVKVPKLRQAVGIILVNLIVSTLVGAVVGLILGILLYTVGIHDEVVVVAIGAALGIPLGMVVAAAVYSRLLDEVSFARGMLIWLVQLVIGLVISAFILVVWLLGLLVQGLS